MHSILMKKLSWSIVFLSFFHSSLVADETDHHHHKSSTKKAINIAVVKMEDKNDKKVIQIELTKTSNGQPVTLNDLKEVHTEKIHLFIVDNSLEDYSHIHPKSLKQPGIYEFEWSPKKPGDYNLWADLFPFETNAQEYVKIALTSQRKSNPQIVRETRMKTQVDGYTFELSFDSKTLKVGEARMGKVRVTDSQNRPVKELEPIMGAFAHIVGFYEDFDTILHVHPMGKEPLTLKERAGPELQFHMEAQQPGFIKLFVQVVIKGKEIFAPFGLQVMSEEAHCH